MGKLKCPKAEADTRKRELGVAKKRTFKTSMLCSGRRRFETSRILEEGMELLVGFRIASSVLPDHNPG